MSVFTLVGEKRITTSMVIVMMQRLSIFLCCMALLLTGCAKEGHPSGLPEAPPNIIVQGLEFNPYGGSHESQIQLRLTADGADVFHMEAETSMLDIQSFEFFSQFPELKSLAIYGGTIHSFQGIEQLESLETLQLSGCALAETALPAMPSLKQVYVDAPDAANTADLLNENPQAVFYSESPDSPEIEAKVTVTWARDWEQENFDEIVAWCDLSGLDCSVPLDSTKIPGLRYLSVYGCSSSAYAPFLQAAGLNRIRFFDCDIDGAPVGGDSEGVTRLTFERCSINSLSGIGQWTELKEISFVECEWNSESSLEALAEQGDFDVLWE